MDMILYKYIADCSHMKLDDTEKNMKNYELSFLQEGIIAEVNRQFYTLYSVEKRYRIIISDVIHNRMTIVVACKAEVGRCECDKSIRTKLPDVKVLTCEEITLEEFEREVVKACRINWIERSKETVFRELGIKINPENYGFFDGAPYKVTECVYSDEGMTKKRSVEQLSEILASDSFYEEINRIYSKQNVRRFMGHPVHYLITTGDKAAAKDMIDILIPALLKNKRLLSGRVCDVQDIKPNAYKEDAFFNIFSASQGGTVVINLSGEQDSGMYATGYHELAEQLGRMLGEYGNNTLFIFVDVSGQRTISNDTIAAILANADMIQLNEGHGDLKKASLYLERLAEKADCKGYQAEELIEYLPNDKTLYSVSDIFTAYNKWYGRGLKDHVYRAYKENDIIRINLKKKTDKPYEELQKMVGLTDVKKVTDEILAVAKMQKMRKEMGLADTKASMHMLFSGNPGTAKTTVARLLAQILKEEEVLKNGHIVECGRQDLVGKYVGWTARIVEEKFRAARGGILFIDEAYSLVEDGRTYGAEAINTIVQQMENYREEMIVIFAGYPDKMRDFLEQNEGLASRIAFHLDFPDYTADELTQIMDLMLEKCGYSIDKITRDKCFSLCSEACKEKNYGNGRFVRNMIEQAIMRQADRLLRGNKNIELSKETVGILISDDFELIGIKKKQSKAMGFVIN